MSATKDFRRASRLARNATTSAIRTGELAMASGEVIARRTAMGAQAMSHPTPAALAEASQMVSEKAFAMSQSGLAAARAFSDLSSRSTALVISEAGIASRTVQAALRCRTPMELAVVQGEFAFNAFGRMMSQGLGLASLAAAAGGATMAPFHTAATANARRLRK